MKMSPLTEDANKVVIPLIFPAIHRNLRSLLLKSLKFLFNINIHL